MKIFIDLDTRKLRVSAANSQPAMPPKVKRGDDTPMEVIYVRGTTKEQLAVASVITFACKTKGEYDGTAVVYDNDFTLSGSGSSAVYSARPSFNTAALNAALMLDADTSNDKASIELMGEITWVDGVTGAVTSTETFAVFVENDVIRGDEAAPAAGSTPIGTTVPVNGAVGVKQKAVYTLTGGDITADGNIRFTVNADGTPFDIEFAVITGDGPDEWASLFADILNITSPYNDLLVATYDHSGADQLLTVEYKVADANFGAFEITVDGFDGATMGYPGFATVLTAVVETDGEPAVPATATPPFFRVAGGFLYVQEAGVWKKTALSAL
jgi:hypothetical protein